MSRRSQRRRSARAGSSSKSGRWLVRILTILLVAVILAGFGVYSWLKNYLHSDDFRVFMGDVAGDVLDSEAHFELFEWQGMHARTASFTSGKGGVVRGLAADGISAHLSLGGVRRGVWEISDVRVSQMELHLDTRTPTDVTESVDQPDTPSSVADKGSDKGFLDGLLPDRAELQSVEVASSKLNLQTTGGYLRANDMAVRMDQGNRPDSFAVYLSSGTVNTSWFPVPLSLINARGKWSSGRVFLTDSEFDVYQRGRLTLNGELDNDDFGFYGTLKQVRAEELVSEDWQKRVMGDVTTLFKVQSGTEHTILRGKVQLKNGVLTQLPVLDHIAAYANTRRFRRLILSEASCNFRKEGGLLEMREVVLASEGLVRVVGDITINSGELDGNFRVGIVPGTLAHIPGAETKVFLRGEKGLLWSPLRITGTIDNPKEDLSRRMIEAAGERMFELVPETGKMALKFAHHTATELPSKAVDATTKILEGDPAGAIEDGADVIRKGVGGVLDLIPGGRVQRQPEDNEEE